MAPPPHKGKMRQRRDDLAETVVKINRCATVVKGGRRFSFSALVVVGDKRGRVGIGYGKANDVPSAIEKGFKKAREAMVTVTLEGQTIPHVVIGRFGAAKVYMQPASAGTGVVASNSVRSIIESVGIHDILTKSQGSNNPINLLKATLEGLLRLRSRAQVAQLRGVEL